jgi:hypothetical protein
MNKVSLTLIVILIAISLGLVGVLHTYIGKYNNERDERERYQNNLYNSQFVIDSIKLSNDAYQYSVNALTVTLDDFKQLNDSLIKDLERQKLKIKNLSSVTRVNSSLKAKIDSLTVVKNKIDTVIINDKPTRVIDYRAYYEDAFLKASEMITIPEVGSPIISNLTLDIDTQLTISDERIYTKKKCWQFWKKKRLQNHKIHITTKNPYLNINRIETYSFE